MRVLQSVHPISPSYPFCSLHPRHSSTCAYAGNVAAAWSSSTAVLLPPLMSALLSALLRDACACLILKMASVSLEVQRCGRGRAGVLVGLDGHEVRLCDPCDHRVSVCARVSRVCPGSPRCLFTGSGLTHCGPKSGVGVSKGVMVLMDWYHRYCKS